MSSHLSPPEAALPNPATGSLHSKRYIVTGASSGIGRATALELSRQGASVIAIGRDDNRLREVLAELEGFGHEAKTFDLKDLNGIPSMIRALAAEGGKIDGLVHCAGIHQTVPLRAIEPSELSSIFETNVSSAFMLAKGLRHKQVRASSPSIVLLASAVGLVGQPGVSAYSASKGAIIAATKSLALELARENIRVNCVCPGVVITPMTDALRQTIGEHAFEAVTSSHPLGLGTPEDVAEAIVFLLSARSRWITGTALTVDGGYTAS